MNDMTIIYVLIGYIIGTGMAVIVFTYYIVILQKKNDAYLARYQSMIDNLARAMERFNGGKKNA
jgi:hypothetical protein